MDGLRGGAMLLGLVLHGVLSFAGIPAWAAEDVRTAPEVIFPFVDWVHGFRMPLFFLVSGFFTAMMWRKRGMGGLVRQRLLRIGVPLVVGTMLVYPAMAVLGIWGQQVKEERKELRVAEKSGGVWEAVLSGRVELLEERLEAGGDPNERDAGGTPALHLAAIIDDGEKVRRLLENGAELEGRDANGGTALMSAFFFGREEAALALLEEGADVEAVNSKGESVRDVLQVDFEVVKAIGGALQIEVREEHREAREKLATRVFDDAKVEVESKSGSGNWWYWKGVFVPVFHHLWFLYDLLWLLVVFVPLAWLAGRVKWRVPALLISVPGCLLWLVPLTWWSQMTMPGSFGPGTSTGIFPWPAKLAYYGIFFFFGALCFGRGAWEEKVGRIWWAWLLASVPLWWFGKDLVKTDVMTGAFVAAVFAWVMIVGLMGLFRRFLNEGRSQIRYLSDSAYWLYLAHMPLMIVVQILISGWEIPLLVKLVIVIGGVTAFLLVIYDKAIRYTGVGAVLNGRKYRTPPLPEDATS